MESPFIIAVSGMQFESSMVRSEGVLTVCGMDPDLLDAGMRRAVAGGACGIISFGTAAGLDPALSPGAIVIASHVTAGQESYPADKDWSARLQKRLPEAVAAGIAGVDSPIGGVEEKASLRQLSGAAAADMESHRVARMAARKQLPFAALRVVLDDAGCALPPAALVSTRKSGAIDFVGLLRSLLAEPSQLPAMRQLMKKHTAAKRSLVYCRDRLRGSLLGFHAR